MKILKRLMYLPLGLIKGLAYLANDHARDLINKKRFRDAIIDGGCSFTEDTIIGKHSHILQGSLINHSKIGNYTYCGRNNIIQNTEIGNYCSIANDVMIGLGTHPIDNFTTSTLFYRKKNTLNIELIDEDLDFDEYENISIGHDVWVGARAIIIDGIKIGHGAVIATGAVVTKNIPDYAIVGGVPAKIIRYRFDNNKIERLLKSKWWSDDITEIKKNMNTLNKYSK